jgi:hypothetical protein
VTLPDSSVRELAPSARGASSVSFVETRQLGVYRVEEVRDASAAETAASPESGSASDGVGPPDEPAGQEAGPTRFAVDLFSATESDIGPGDGSRIAALGGTATPEVGAAGIARDEWWPPLVALALAGLLLEWAVYERDGLRRIRDGLRSGLRVRPVRAGRR